MHLGLPFLAFKDCLRWQMPTYVVWTSGTLCQTMNTNTGIIEYSGTSSTSGIQWALNNLTSGRAYKETVKIKGFHNIAKILFPRILHLT